MKAAHASDLNTIIFLIKAFGDNYKPIPHAVINTCRASPCSTRICHGCSEVSAKLAARVGVQKQAALVILALDLRCIYTHEQPFKFEEWVFIGLS